MRTFLLLCIGLFLTLHLSAQRDSADSLKLLKSLDEKRVDLTVMPFFSYNRNLKVMLGVIPMMMYKIHRSDSISPKSLTGLSAVYTTNGSYFVTLFNRFYFAEDKWRAKLVILSGDYTSQFFMEGLDGSGFYDYATETSVISAGMQRRVGKGIYAGMTYTYAHYHTEYANNVQPSTTSRTNGMELNTMLDTRDKVYYPYHGKKANLRWINFGKWFGNEYSANKIVSDYNQYIPLRSQRDVLALRYSGKYGVGDIVFEQQVTIGGKDIRGYSEGKYRGDGLIALQSEYRYNFGARMGMVGFAGLATLYGSATESFDWKLYPGIGLGYRYRAFKTVKFNIGLDAALGKDDWGVYFRIGEAF